MIKDGKAYFVNPWFNREVQMPEFAGVEWGEAGRRPFINEDERDQIAAALLRFAEKTARDEQAAFTSAIERQRIAAEQGEIDRLAQLGRQQAKLFATPQAEAHTPRTQQATAPQQPTRATGTRVEANAQQAGRGQPIRVVVQAGALDRNRITARVVR